MRFHNPNTTTNFQLFMKNLFGLLASAIIGSAACTAQLPYFSLSAGTDGVNFNVTNQPIFPTVIAAPPHHHHHLHYFHHAPEPEVCIPLMPGVRFVDAPSHKAYHKAAKAYRKATHQSAGMPGISVTLPGGITVSTPGTAVPVYYYDNDDLEDYYDDYKDYLKHRNKEARKHAKKIRKQWEKHHGKHHGKHHHHDED